MSKSDPAHSVIIFLGALVALCLLQEKAELFGEILADLQDKYVEPINVDKLAETGYQAMLSSLDPYTEFESLRRRCARPRWETMRASVSW